MSSYKLTEVYTPAHNMKIKNILLMAMAALVSLTSCTPKETETAQETKKEVGLQLYSVRGLMEEGQPYNNDLPGLLNMLDSIGYTQFEAANYDQANGTFYGLTPAELKKVADEAGVKIISSHTGRTLNADELKGGDLTDFYNWWAKCIADHKAAGMEYIVVPWMSVPETKADLKKQCEAFNEIAKRCAKEGIKFGYHNHSHEFQEVEGEPMYTFMIENTDPEVLFEMDVYWAVMGQAAPVDLFNKYPGRFKLLHIKDRREIGQSGMVNFQAIFDNADKAGLENYFVEIEEYTDGTEKGAKESADYLVNAPYVKASYSK